MMLLVFALVAGCAVSRVIMSSPVHIVVVACAWCLKTMELTEETGTSSLTRCCRVTDASSETVLCNSEN